MKIRDLLDSPEKWTKEALARDRDGAAFLEADDNGAVCWCLSGAMHRCYPDPKARHLVRLLIEVELGSMVHWNDKAHVLIALWNDDPTRTFADIRALIEKLDV